GGDQDTALRLYQRLVADYPSHYYSTQAQAGLQEAGGRAMLGEDPALPTAPVLLQDAALLPESPQGQPGQARFHLIRVQELHQLQMYQPAGQEIRALAPVLPHTPAAQYLLASLYVDNQQRPAAFRVLNGVLEALSPTAVRGLPREFWTTLYPQ